MAHSPHTPTRSTTPEIANAEESFASTSTDIFPTPHQKETLSSGTSKRFAPLRAASTPPELMTSTTVRSLSRGTPGDGGSTTDLQKDWESQRLAKKRSEYYNNVFAIREPINSARERVIRDSVIIAELKLSGALDGDTSLVSDFSFHLAQIYQRPESCILLTVHDSTLLVFGGCCDPAYLLSITALSTEVAPTKNKRTTAMAQDFLNEALGIPPRRGVLKFTAIAEEDLGTNGMTVLGEIEALQRATAGGGNGFRSFSRSQMRKAKKNSSTPLLDQSKSGALLTPPASKTDVEDAKSRATDAPSTERKPMKRRRSFLSFFGVRM